MVSAVIAAPPNFIQLTTRMNAIPQPWHQSRSPNCTLILPLPNTRKNQPPTKKARLIQDPWSNPCPEPIETTTKLYTEVVHWKPVLIIFSKK